MKKYFASIAAVCTAAAVMSISAAAVSIETDLGMGWSASTTVSGSDFADVTENTQITVTYTADTTLADMPGQDYWCVKYMINDAGWPFISGISGLELTEAGDAYVVDPDASSMTFSLPASELEHIQTSGIAIMGHGLTIHEMSFAEGSAPAGGDSGSASGETTTAPTTPAPDKAENPDTGVAGIAGAAAAAVVAAGALAVSRKRR